MDNYLDIIDLEHYEPKFHKRMSKYNRAAQFAPFSALKGYEELVYETSRYTNKKIELSIEEEKEINYKLNYLNKYIHELPKVTVLYFIKDNKKEGGKYKTVTKNLKAINKLHNYIKFSDNSIIPINDILNIISDLFKKYEM